MRQFPIKTLLLSLGVLSLSAINPAFAQSKHSRFSYDYDNYGRLNLEQVDDSSIHYQRYSNHGMTMDVVVSDEVDTTQVINNVEIDYDGAARKVHYGHTAGNDYTHFITDAFSVLSSSHLYQNGSPLLRENNLVYDAAGRLKQYYRYHKSDAAEVFKYRYDDMGKLTRFSVGGQWHDYGYDARGNLNYKSGIDTQGYKITSLPTQVFNDKNQNVTNPAWQYDGEGNLIADETYKYKYNAANRLVQVSDAKTNKWIAHYLYDSSGNRVRKITPDTTTYYFRNNAGNIAYEQVYQTDSGELIKKVRHVEANGVNVASVTTTAQGDRTVEYQYNNRLKSQSVRWDDNDKTVLQEYSPFGEQMKVGATHQGAFGYTQHEDDLDSGSVYMKARHYKPLYGRMNRPDPVRDFDIYNPSSFNLYAYVGNDPVNAWDPSGMSKEWSNIIGGAGKIVGGIGLAAGIITLTVLTGGTGLAAAAMVTGATAMGGFKVVEGAVDIADGLGSQKAAQVKKSTAGGNAGLAASGQLAIDMGLGKEGAAIFGLAYNLTEFGLSVYSFNGMGVEYANYLNSVNSISMRWIYGYPLLQHSNGTAVFLSGVGAASAGGAAAEGYYDYHTSMLNGFAPPPPNRKPVTPKVSTTVLTNPETIETLVNEPDPYEHL